MKREEVVSDIEKRLIPIGRILEDENYNVWGCSPVYGDDGLVHVFYSRWKNKYDHTGWLSACEIAHAVADKPEGPYRFVGVALSGRGGNHWDSWTIHNPSVYKVDGKFVLLYLGSDGSKLNKTCDELSEMSKEESSCYFKKLVQTQRVGMAITDDLNKEWTRISDKMPTIDISDDSKDWDSACVSNPAFVKTPEGKYRYYYKAFGKDDREKNLVNRRYGFAEAEKLEGPYIKYAGNPVVDFSKFGKIIQLEDAYIWYEKEKYHIIMRDMGVFNHEYGLYIKSENGIDWSEPEIGYYQADKYFKEEILEISREGRFERPQMLMNGENPEYLFCAFRGGKYKTSSGVVFKIANT
ncbi:MAG: glycoside hydrolase family protein [Clostridia bacterium]